MSVISYGQGPGVQEPAPIIGCANNQKSNFWVKIRGLYYLNIKVLIMSNSIMLSNINKREGETGEVDTFAKT